MNKGRGTSLGGVPIRHWSTQRPKPYQSVIIFPASVFPAPVHGWPSRRSSQQHVGSAQRAILPPLVCTMTRALQLRRSCVLVPLFAADSVAVVGRRSFFCAYMYVGPLLPASCVGVTKIPILSRSVCRVNCGRGESSGPA